MSAVKNKSDNIFKRLDTTEEIISSYEDRVIEMAEKTVGEKEQNLSDLEILKDKENLEKNTGRNVD